MNRSRIGKDLVIAAFQVFQEGPTIAHAPRLPKRPGVGSANAAGFKYCRPATLEDLKTLIASLNQQKADYLLIGGYGLFAHGYHRATTDINVLVPANKIAGKKIIAALMVLPDHAAKDIGQSGAECENQD